MRSAPTLMLLATLSLALAGCADEASKAPSASASPAATAPAPAATATAAPSAAPAEAAPAPQASAEGKPSGGGDLAAELADLARAEAAIDGALKRDGAAPLAAGAAEASCSTACTALASMRRATLHVCEMVGDRDAKCLDGRARTRAAEARVKAACPTCG